MIVIYFGKYHKRRLCQVRQQPGRGNDWLVWKRSEKVSSQRKEKWEEALFCTEKRLVQSVRNLHCTEAVDEFGKEGRGKKMIPLGPVLELEL